MISKTTIFNILQEIAGSRQQLSEGYYLLILINFCDKYVNENED